MYSSGRQTEDHIIRKHMNIICFLTVFKKKLQNQTEKRESTNLNRTKTTTL